MQLQPVTLVLAMCISVDGAARSRGHAAVTPQYAEYTLNDDERAPSTLDYDDQQGMNVKKVSEENIEDIDMTNKYKPEIKYKPQERYRRPHNHPRDANLNHPSATTEQWADDIEVDINHHFFTKKNKVAKTGSRSEYEKLKFAYKDTTNKLRLKSSLKHAEHDMNDNIMQVELEDSEDRKWRSSEKEQHMKQTVEESEEPPRWMLGTTDRHGDYVYYDVKRLNKYKSFFVPLNHKVTEKIPQNIFAQSVSPTSLAERELQAYLNIHRLRKAADGWLPTTERLTEESSGVTHNLFSSSADSSTGASLVSVHRRGGAAGRDTHVSGSGAVVNNFTFPPLAVDAAFEHQWKHFITETRNETEHFQSENMIYICLIIILYLLQRYNQIFLLIN